MTNLLLHYERKATGLTDAQLRYALGDITSTLRIWRDRPPTDPYIAKLLAEFDAYTVELYRRERKDARRAVRQGRRFDRQVAA
jgi:hypothetical protein